MFEKVVVHQLHGLGKMPPDSLCQDLKFVQGGTSPSPKPLQASVGRPFNH